MVVTVNMGTRTFGMSTTVLTHTHCHAHLYMYDFRFSEFGLDTCVWRKFARRFCIMALFVLRAWAAGGELHN